MKRFFKLKRILFSALLATFLLHACSKGDITSEFGYHEINTEFKAYAAFDSASYWVYHRYIYDTIFIDTVQVNKVKFDRRFHSTSNETGFFYDAIEMNLAPSGGTAFSKLEITAGSAYENSQLDENLRLYTIDGKYYTILMPHIIPDSIVHLGGIEGDYSNTAFHSSVFVNEVSYTDVYETRVTSYPNTDSATTREFMIAKNFGLIKYKIKNSTGGNDVEWVLSKSQLRPIE